MRYSGEGGTGKACCYPDGSPQLSASTALRDPANFSASMNWIRAAANCCYNRFASRNSAMIQALLAPDDRARTADRFRGMSSVLAERRRRFGA